MNRRLSALALGAGLAASLAFHAYSGPKTLNVGGAGPLAAPSYESGIPADYGDLLTVDAGYLYFVDGEGTIRRLGLTADGVVQGPLVTVHRR
ncbi:MAG: hypothetical protein HYY25_06160 [Candidatus Wallbacteria bacterium]|nr:hypothetical protein [Candidatus Wallbacteria bacterium]MBI4868990.1 hypothetical protein [Candidatus Wallbacteria bacterium]